jgi:hypothetical protein
MVLDSQTLDSEKKNHWYVLCASEYIFPSEFWGSDHNHANNLRKQNNSTVPQNSHFFKNRQTADEVWTGPSWNVAIHVQQHAILPFVVSSFFHVATYTLLRWTGSYIICWGCAVQCNFICLFIFQANVYYVTEPHSYS